MHNYWAIIIPVNWTCYFTSYIKICQNEIFDCDFFSASTNWAIKHWDFFQWHIIKLWHNNYVHNNSHIYLYTSLVPELQHIVQYALDMNVNLKSSLYLHFYNNSHGGKQSQLLYCKNYLLINSIYQLGSISPLKHPAAFYLKDVDQALTRWLNNFNDYKSIQLHYR